MRAHTSIILLSPIAIFAACQAPYVPINVFTGRAGYEDKQLGPNRYFVRIVGNAYTEKATLVEYFHRRGAELCPGRRYEHSISFTTTKYANPNIPATHTFPVAEGEIRCSAI